jgi:hypothetical protein
MTVLPSNPPQSAPARLRALWPLVIRFGKSDDGSRAMALSTASSEALKALVTTVNAERLREIDDYLNAVHDAEEAVPFGDLAQATLEAATLLQGREVERDSTSEPG